VAFFRKAVLVNGATLLGLVIRLGQTVILTRVLGPAGIGQYSLVSSIVMLAAQVCTLGFPGSLLYACQHDPANKKQHTMDGLWATLVLGLIGAVILAVVSKTQGGYFGPLSWTACMIGASYVLVTPLSGITRNNLLCTIAARRLSLIAVASMAIPLALVVCLALAKRLDVTTALAAFVLTSVVRLAMGGWWARREVDLRVRPQLSGVGQLAWMGVRLSGTDVMVLLNSTLNIMMLKALAADFDGIGYFSRGQQLAMAVVMASQAVLPLLFSRWAALPEAQIARSFELVMRFLATLSAAVLVVMCVSSRALIVVLYGERFLPAVMPMVILLPGTVFFLLSKVATQLLGSRGLPEVSVGILALATGINVALSWVLIPCLGIQGAAVASTVGNLVLLISLMAVMGTRYGVRWGRCLWLTRADYRGMIKQLQWNGNRVREPQGRLLQV